MGVDYVMLHLGFDESKYATAKKALDGLDDLVSAVHIPVGIATFCVEEAVEAVKRGASWVVQGEPLLSDPDGEKKLTEYIQRVKNLSL